MLTANSAAILTDAFPAEQRGFALGTNQVAGLAGMFIGLVAGGLLAALDWRAVFWVNVPVGIYGTAWAYLKLRETGSHSRTPIDWWGNVTFALGLSAILIASTYGIQPYGGHTMGWTDPWVIGGLAGGALLLAVVRRDRAPGGAPMVNLGLFALRPFAAGNLAGFSISLARGGLQFMLVIWLQGIWLPLHGYSFARTPLWAGIYMLPLTAGFLIAGPVSGTLSDRIGSRGIASAGAALTGAAFLGLMLLPVDFPYPAFALLLALSGAATGMFASPNSSSIMGSVPAAERGVASGMRSTFQNSGTAISIGVFFTLVIAGVASSLPAALRSGLIAGGAPLTSPTGSPRCRRCPACSERCSASTRCATCSRARATCTCCRPPVATRSRAARSSRTSSPRRSTTAWSSCSRRRPGCRRSPRSPRWRAGDRSRSPPYPQHRKDKHAMTPEIDPARTALLVMDYQNGVIGRVADGDELIAAAREAIELMRERGGHIGYVRVAFADGEAPTGTMGSRIDADAARTTFHADAPATQVHDGIAPRDGDIVVRKTRVGPFGTTDLDARLRERGVDTLLLAGISTSGVVLSTVRDGHDRDYRLIVVSDLCADFEPDVHAFLTERIFPRQADVIDSSELRAALS